jgi:hypothetical protein
MKQQLRLPSLLLFCTLTIGSLTSAYAQKAPVRKPAAITKAVAPQGLTMQQFLNIDNLIYLPSVDEYLTTRNWQFIESKPGTEYDKVAYKRKSPGFSDAILLVSFCSQASNSFCFNPSIHDGQQSQHVFAITYVTNKAVYEKIKAEVKTTLQLTNSIVKENKITTVYQGNSYQFRFSVDTSGGTTDYLVSYKELEQETDDSE